MLSSAVRAFSNFHFNFVEDSVRAKIDVLFHALRQDVSGAYKIAGTVSFAGIPLTPADRRVNLYSAFSGKLVAQQWSGPDGTYSFDWVRQGPWMVVAQDYTNAYNAAVADNQYGELM